MTTTMNRSSDRIAVRFRVSGRVQGVGFRWWTVKRAQEKGLVGSVRNCPDGSVAIEAAGSSTSIEAFRRELAEGPPGAVVQEVEEEAVGHLEAEGFQIRS